MTLTIGALTGFGGGGGGGGAITISHTDDASKTPDASAFTFPGLSLGTAVAGRLIACTVMFRSQGSAITSATINGVSATRETVSTNGNYSVQIIWAQVDADTTGDVVINADGTFRNCAVSVYRITGQASNTPADVDIDGGSGIASPTVDFPSPPANGVAVYCFMNSRTSEDPGSWTNSLTENVNVDFENEHIASAHKGPGTVQDSAYQRDSDPGVDTWTVAVVAGAAWS